MLGILSVCGAFGPTFLIEFFLVFVVCRCLLWILVYQTVTVVCLVIAYLNASNVNYDVRRFRISTVRHSSDLDDLSYLRLRSLRDLRTLR